MIFDMLEWSMDPANILWIAIPSGLIIAVALYGLYDGAGPKGSFEHFATAIVFGGMAGFGFALAWPAILAIGLFMLAVYLLWLLLRAIGIIKGD